MKISLFLLIVALCVLPIFSFAQQKVWLDSDTGNEMDDLYAIAHLAKSKKIELIGLSSAHFNNPDLLVFEKWNAYDTKGLNTVGESQRLNEEILASLGRLDIPHPLGSDRQIGRAWGQQDSRDSPAVQAMIAAARSIPHGEKLDILTLGALSNIASALILAPDILPKIRVFSLGAKYNPDNKVWNKSEFNIRNDLNAFDYMLNLERLDFTVMPLEAAFPLQFERERTYEMLDESVEIERILEDRWKVQNPQDKTRVMWDLALVAAYLHPELAKIEIVSTPPENSQRAIRAYVKIDAPALESEFWKILKEKQ